MRQRRCDDKQGTVIAKRAPQLGWVARSEDVKSHRDGILATGMQLQTSATTAAIRVCALAARRAACFDKSTANPWRPEQAVKARGEVVGRAGSDLQDQSVRRRVRGGERSDGVSKRSVVSGAQEVSAGSNHLGAVIES
jgi:hypothetical protein